MKYIYKTAILFTVLGIFAIPQYTHAATVGVEPQEVSISLGEEFELEVFFDTEGATINALEGSVVFDENKFDLVDIHTGKSFVSLWVTQPAEEERGRVVYSGIIPGGYKEVINPENGEESKGIILELVLRPKESGESEILPRSSVLYHNDGFGTEVKTREVGSMVAVSNEEKSLKIESLDERAPVFVESRLIEEPESGKTLLVFLAEDKETGINHYEIREEGEEWKVAESPYEVGKKARKPFYIKAIDKNGNASIVKVGPEEGLQALSKVILPLLILLLIWFVFNFVRQNDP